MIEFEERKSLAGTLQPGDGTRYEMVAVKEWDNISIIVMNEDFFDKIIFPYDDRDEPYYTFRGEKTNPWTIRAALNMRNRLLEVLK